MKCARTTITLPEVVLNHIKNHLDDTDTIAAFLERAAINQLEKEFMDYEIRVKVEEEYGREETA